MIATDSSLPGIDDGDLKSSFPSIKCKTSRNGALFIKIQRVYSTVVFSMSERALDYSKHSYIISIIKFHLLLHIRSSRF